MRTAPAPSKTWRFDRTGNRADDGIRAANPEERTERLDVSPPRRIGWPAMSTATDAADPAPPRAPLQAADFIPLLLQTGFSAETYRDRHADLAGMNWSASQALSHFLTRGLHERRIVPFTLNRPALLALARLPMHDTEFKARLLTFLAGHLFDGTGHPFGPAIHERWPVVQDLAAAGARPYFVAGDSHTNQYRLTGARGDAWLLPIHLLCTGGSAAGLGNPASRSGYGAQLKQAAAVIETLPGIETIPFLMMFGQVDIEFVHHFQRVRDGQLALNLDDYRAFCDRTVQRYIQFVSGLTSVPGRLRIFLVSVFPPALSDAAWQQGHVNADIVQREATQSVSEMSLALRRLEVASLRQRTDIHLYYNDLLRSACARHGFGFVDSATPFLGASGIVDPRYIVPEADGTEHHLDDRVTFDEVGRLIWQSIELAAGNNKSGGNIA
jgi:hypothetical protein